jgi:hypothetical protein
LKAEFQARPKAEVVVSRAAAEGRGGGQQSRASSVKEHGLSALTPLIAAAHLIGLLLCGTQHNIGSVRMQLFE